MGFFDWMFGQDEIQMKQTPMEVPWANPVWMDFLFSGFQKDPNGHYSLQGLPAYPGQLTPDVNQTMLPNVWGSWNPQGNAGTQALQGMMGFQMPQQISGGFENMLNFGGAAQGPTSRMATAADWGGPAGPGTQGISNMMQFGVPSEAGRYLANLAQFGITGPAGQPIHDRAMGKPTAANNYLMMYSRPATEKGGKK